MPKNMTARAEAREAGRTTYETGIPCKQGHLAPRNTKTGTCCACTQAAHEKWLARNEGKGAKYAAAYRERHKALTLERGRKSQAKRRETMPEKIRAIAEASYMRRAIAANGVYRPGGTLLPHEIQARFERNLAPSIRYVGGYTGMHAPAEFFCTTHNLTVQAAPHNALRGANPCPRCNHMKSKAEDDVFAHLAKLTPAVQRDRTLIKPKELDIYLPEKSLAVEYCGMYWHSLFSAEEVKAKKDWHSTKHQECAAKGVRLITIYEAEWLEHTYAIKRLLRNAIGRGRGKLMARKCELRKVVHAEAVAFYDRYHPQGGAGNGDHYGLYWKGKLVACMRFNLGANDRGAAAADRVWTLTRYATRITVAGGASRLFKAFLAEHRPSVVKSFSDNRYFDGGMYEKLGFTLESTSAPDYQVWSPKIGLRPKTHYQRRVLPQRLQDHEMEETFDPATDTRTEAEMTFLMRCGRIYDCGKKRWVWTAPSAA